MEKELEQRIQKLEQEIDFLKSFTTIPFEVEGAFRNRLGIAELAKIIISTKGATTENQSVNEAGSSSYSVLKAPDLFVQVPISGTTYYIPVFT